MKRGNNILSQLAVLTAVLFSSQVYAQGEMGGFGGEMGGGGDFGQSSSTQITPENMLTSTGYFLIDSDEAIKKIKIKDSAKEQTVRAIFATYEADYNTLSVDYSAQIDSMLMEEARPGRGGMQRGEGSSESGERTERGQRGEGGESGERGERGERGEGGDGERGGRMQERGGGKMALMNKLTEVATPMHESLQESLKATLDDKEYQRWDKYYEKLKEKNYVGTIEEKMQEMRSSMGGGMRGGMGGMGGGGMGGF